MNIALKSFWSVAVAAGALLLASNAVAAPPRSSSQNASRAALGVATSPALNSAAVTPRTFSPAATFKAPPQSALKFQPGSSFNNAAKLPARPLRPTYDLKNLAGLRVPDRLGDLGRPSKPSFQVGLDSGIKLSDIVKPKNPLRPIRPLRPLRPIDLVDNGPKLPIDPGMGNGPIKPIDPGMGNGSTKPIDPGIGNGSDKGQGPGYGKGGKWHGPWGYGGKYGNKWWKKGPHFCPPWFNNWCWFPGYDYCYGYSSGVCLTEIVYQPVYINCAAPVIKPALLNFVPGTIVTLSGQNFGDEPGKVMLLVSGIALAAEVKEWTPDSVTFAVPMMGLAAPTKAELLVLRANGAVARNLGCRLVGGKAPPQMANN